MTAALILFGVSAAVAQSAVTGKIVDETGAPLIGASVTVPGTSQGVSTDVDGNFTLKTDAKEIEISYVGYVPTKKPVTGPNARLGIIQMEPDAVALQDVIVMQSVAVQRKTPVAVSTVNAEEISYKLGGQEFPEILKSTPGVYVTKDGGGFGDSKINMRGFQAANVAVMVNGVPVNDMEWGGVYWSNWAGLSDVTRSMQTQRGLGASKISSPSVGGSVNIVTNGIEAKQGGTFSFGVGNDGQGKPLQKGKPTIRAGGANGLRVRLYGRSTRVWSRAATLLFRAAGCGAAGRRLRPAPNGRTAARGYPAPLQQRYWPGGRR